MFPLCKVKIIPFSLCSFILKKTYTNGEYRLIVLMLEL